MVNTAMADLCGDTHTWNPNTQKKPIKTLRPAWLLRYFFTFSVGFILNFIHLFLPLPSFPFLPPSFLSLSAVPHSVSYIKFLPRKIHYWCIGKALVFISCCFAGFVYQLQEPLRILRVLQIHKQGSWTSFFLMNIRVSSIAQRAWLTFQVLHWMKVMRLTPLSHS